jgi:prenyltransferase beta subunit
MSDSVKKYYENSRCDKIVQDVVQKYNTRSEIGIKKYGTTLEDSKEGQLDFLNHLLEELMDATLYIQKSISIMAEKTEEEKFTEARIEFLLETIAKQNNLITIQKGQIENLKKTLHDYESRTEQDLSQRQKHIR